MEDFKEEDVRMSVEETVDETTEKAAENTAPADAEKSLKDGMPADAEESLKDRMPADAEESLNDGSPAGAEESMKDGALEDTEKAVETEAPSEIPADNRNNRVTESVGATSALQMDESDLVGVVGVRFRTAGKSYYFAVGDLPVKRGTHVIVETARGLEFGTSVCDPMKIHQRQFKAPIKKLVRIATESDEKRVRENREKEREALRVCFEKIRQHNLDMKLIDAEYTFDNSKILFYFTSDGRVDFRDLVKDLAGVFHTRIELRQIGVRDETKILGGYGICGRPLCCHTYLADFIPVSIKMAKEQNLSLNPTKISGSCGRLMCCLKNEEETYEELNKTLPKLGDEVQTSDGLTGEVASVNILKQTVRILVEVDDEKELHECSAGELTILRRRKRGQAKPKINRSELKNTTGNNRRGSQPGKDRLEQERSEKEEKEDREERTEHGERQDGSERPARSDRADRRDRSGRNGRPDRNDRPDRSERQERGERSDRGERQERGERPNRSEHQDREERSNRNERWNKGGREERGENSESGQNGQTGQNDREGRGRRDRNGRYDRRNRRDRQAGEERENANSAGTAAERDTQNNDRPASEGTQQEGGENRRRHRYRRRNNDRRREEKPSATE